MRHQSATVAPEDLRAGIQTIEKFGTPVDGAADNVIVVPDADLLLSGAYKRAGGDLVLTGDDGRQFVVQDYFRTEKQLPLASPKGDIIGSDLVGLLAGPENPGQYAQAAPTPAVAPVGRVVTLTGTATVVRNGVQTELNVGDSVFKSDVVQTGSNSTLGLSFIDGTVMNLSANARMALTEYVYQDGGTSNASMLSVLQGTFAFVAGQVAKTGDMKIDTPVATLGIRGTTGGGIAATIQATVGQVTYQFFLREDYDTGNLGAYVITDKNGNPIGTQDTTATVTVVSQGINQPPSFSEQPISPEIAQQLQVIFQQLQLTFQQRADLQPKSTTGHGSSTLLDLFRDALDHDTGNTLQLTLNVPLPGGNQGPGQPTFNFDVPIFVKVNTPPFVSVSPVIDTETLNQNPVVFNIGDHVHIVDPDQNDPNFNDSPVSYLPGSGVLQSATGPAQLPSGTDLAALISINPATGVVTYDTNGFAFLAGNESVVYVIGFDIQSGPDVIHQTITLVINGVNQAPTITVSNPPAETESDAGVPALVTIALASLVTIQDVDANDVHVPYAGGLTIESATGPLPGGGSLAGLFQLNAADGTITFDRAAFDYLPGDTQLLVTFGFDVQSGPDVVHKTVTLAINGVDDPTVVSGQDTGSVTEAGGVDNSIPGTPTVNGALVVTDVDGSQAFDVQTDVATSYGHFSIDAAGNWTYTLDNDNAAVEALNSSGTLHDIITVATVEGPTHQIDITINGAADAAVITGTDTGVVTEAGGLNNGTPGSPTAVGTLAVADVDNPSSFVTQTDAATTYGHFTIGATGEWSYALNNANAAVQALNASSTPLHDVITVSAADGTTHQVDITINGANDAAVIAGTATGNVREDGVLAAGGALAVTDVDTGEALFQTPASLAGTYGTFSFNAETGVWGYTLNNAAANVQALGGAQTVHDQLTVTSADGTASQIIDVAVQGTNDAPAGTDNTVVTLEDQGYVFKLADFGFTDPVDAPDDAIAAVKITSVPTTGTLMNGASALAAGAIVSAAAIASGQLVFVPAANANGLAYANFTFQVQDAGGTANGGADLDPSANTMTIDVTPVDDPRLIVGSAGNDQAGSLAAHTVTHPEVAGFGAITGGSANDTLLGDIGVPVPRNVNAILALDSSGSMSSSVVFDGQVVTRLQALKGAVNELLHSLAFSGSSNVRVHLIDFDSVAHAGATFDLIVDGVRNDAGLNGAMAYVNAMVADGGTNYEGALQAALNWINSSGAAAPLDNAVVNQLLFESDGDPTNFVAANGATGGTGGTTAANITASMNEVLGSDGTNEVFLIENHATRPFQIEAVGFTLTDQSPLIRLGDVEDGVANGGDGVATNITAAAQFNGVIAAPALALASVGNDNLTGGDGNDVIFGDAPFTDTLAAAQGLSTAPGSGWLVFQQLGWSPGQIADYLRSHQAEIAQESLDAAGRPRAGGNDVISSGGGNDVVFGQEGNDTIVGGAGNDVMSGGSGGDTFVFRPGSGVDVIIDFVPTGPNHDLIEIFDAGFTDFDSLSLSATAGGTLVDFGNGSSVTLQQVSVGSLTAANFLIHA